MTLADELKGLRPIRLPGHRTVVINDDPIVKRGPSNRRGAGNIGRVIAMLATGNYSARDIDTALGFPFGTAHAYLNKLERRGEARRLGKRSGMKKGQPETVWSK